MSAANACPAIVTIAMSGSGGAARLGERLERSGFVLSYRSRYLMERNWIQVCLMGAVTGAEVSTLLDALARETGGRTALQFGGSGTSLAGA